MRNVKQVTAWRVVRKCGHETDHPLRTSKKLIKLLTESECGDCVPDTTIPEPLSGSTGKVLPTKEQWEKVELNRKLGLCIGALKGVQLQCDEGLRQRIQGVLDECEARYYGCTMRLLSISGRLLFRSSY